LRHVLTGGDVAQGQPDPLRRSLVVGTVAAGLDDLSQPRVYAFQGIRCVDHAANRRGKREERDHVRAIRMSWQPRVFRSVTTFIQNVAPSVCSIPMPRLSRLPSGKIASAR
jgi:hypothetical protein